MAHIAAAADGPVAIGRRGLVLALALMCSDLRAQPVGARSAGEEAQMLERAAFQRALSQRLTKAYLMLAQGIAPAQAARILEESRAEFERNLSWLQGASPSADASRRLVELGERWAEFRPLLDRPPSRAGAEALYGIGDQTEAAAHRATIAFEAALRAGDLRGLMMAGRLRMLSERTAKFWLFRHWGLNAAAADMEIHLARAHFTALLTQVERVGLAPPAATAAGALRQHWPTYDALLLNPASAPADLVLRSEQNFALAQGLVRAMVGPVDGANAPASSGREPGKR